jgi:adenylate kinase family enzyme
MAAQTGLQQSPQMIVELVGPAGAGKTTLSRALIQRNENFRIGPDIELRKVRHIPLFVGNIPFLMPVYLQRNRSNRPVTWGELKYIAYLKGWPRFLRQGAPDQGNVVLLDHGPVFRLATLLEFGPETLRARALRSWWDQLYRQWAYTLDMIVWLDASDATLIDRINARDRGHDVKGKGRAEARQFLTRYRMSYLRTLEALQAHRLPVLLHFDTGQVPLDQIVNEVLTACQPAH